MNRSDGSSDKAYTKDTPRKLWRIIEQIADSVMLTDMGGRIEYVNPAFEKLTGYKSSEVLGKTPAFLKSSRHNLAFYRNMWQTILSGKTFRGTLVNKKKNGNFYYSEKTITPVKNKKGDIVQFISTDRDITRAKLAEEDLEKYLRELARSNAELEQFTRVTSHDLQEPLRMVVSYLQLLERSLGTDIPANAREFLHFATDGAYRMEKTIRNILDCAKVHVVLNTFEKISLESSLTLALRNLEISIRENNATITHSPLPMVAGDEDQLAQVFQNIIGNALKYRAVASPEIHVGCRETEDEWVFSVADNGIGIRPEETKKIFGMFHRLHTERFPGRGIGLAICDNVIARHGGKIWVESEEGVGSTFYFTLPKRSGAKYAPNLDSKLGKANKSRLVRRSTRNPEP